MTREELDHIFEETKPNWTKKSAFRGLKILSKYTENVIIDAGRDIIYSDYVDNVLKVGITHYDALALRSMGWIIKHDCFACYTIN